MTLHRSIAAGLLAAALLTPGLPATVRSQITGVTVRVDGLACPFCAYSLEKRLAAVQGVQDLAIDVQEGIAELVPHDGTPIDLDALPEAVKKAGFTPREIRVAGIGRIAIVEEYPALVAPDGSVLFRLEANDLLAGLETGQAVELDFAGTVVPRAGDEQPSEPRRLVLAAATPRGDDEEG